MDSSSSHELTLVEGGRLIATATTAGAAFGTPPRSPPQIRSDQTILLTMKRAWAHRPGRLRGGTDVLMELAEGQREQTINLGIAASLADDYGELELIFEEAEDSVEPWVPILGLIVEVEPRPGFQEIVDAILRDLEATHLGLARDVLARTSRKGGALPWEPRLLQPQEDLSRIGELRTRLRKALARIGDQPSLSLVSRIRVARWRAGDKLDSRTICEAGRRRRTGPIQTEGMGTFPRMRLSKPELSSDIEEHRHIRDGIERMAAWSEGLAEFCRKAAAALLVEQTRWGSQVFESRYLPRIRSYEILVDRARRSAAGLRQLLSSHTFLQEAGPPRTRFGPTPIFLGRDSYRLAYDCLCEARQRFGTKVDVKNALSIRTKRFSVLYEYWCFMTVVETLRGALGMPEVHGGYVLVDDIYHPELVPGQSFVFSLPGQAKVTAVYEPEFPPAGESRAAPFVAAWVSAPLRPDVIVEIRSGKRPSVMLALDAKSTRTFSREAFRSISDYRGLVHDVATGHQPIRQLFLLHADIECPPLVNVTGYLSGQAMNPQSSILGAVPCLPGAIGHLRTVIERFLSLWL